jgi:tetratricopeptide (TPR) repeat protein
MISRFAPASAKREIRTEGGKMAKKKKPPNRRTRAAGPRLRDFDQVDSLMARRHWVEARALLQDLDQAYPQRTELLRRLVEVAVPLEDAHTYQYGCERLYALQPHDRHLPFMLTTAYVKNGWLGLALTMGRRALAQDPANEKAQDIRSLLSRLEPLVKEEVTRLGLDGADGLECLTLHDQVRSLLAQGRYAKSHEIAEQLASRRPRFGPAYNNGAEACFHQGLIAKAIDLEQRLLDFEPDNVYALSNLVRFLCVFGKGEEARRHAQRLKALKPMFRDSAVKQAEALAWLGDDAGVLAVFEQGRQLEGSEGPRDDALLYHLAAVAAYRQGREEEARGYWRSALRGVPGFELARSNLDDLDRPASERNAPWSYPFNYFVPKKLIDGLLAQIAPVRGQDADATVKREAQQYLAAHPELEGLVPLLLDRSDGVGRELALHLAGLFRTPAMLQAVRDFALGQRGADRLRIRAAELAHGAGLLPPGPRRLWLNGAWHDSAVQRFEVHTDAVEHPHAPGVFDLLTEGITALRAGNASRAERVLRKALAIDPNDPQVMNNLAVACAELGRTEESEALSMRLHERHPDYLFGRTALASLAAERGDLDRARKLLEPLLTRPRLHVSEFSALCMAEINLFLAEGDRQQVEHWLQMWREVAPAHPSLGVFEARLQSMRPSKGGRR